MSPGQYSTPRVEGLPASRGTWKTHVSLPVVGSSATTRPYGEEMYITPLTTIGVVWLGAKPEPRPRPPRPGAGGGAGAGAAVPAGTGGAGGLM